MLSDIGAMQTTQWAHMNRRMLFYCLIACRSLDSDMRKQICPSHPGLTFDLSCDGEATNAPAPKMPPRGTHTANNNNNNNSPHSTYAAP